MSEIDKAKFYKVVTGLFTGQEFTIRKIRIKDYMVELGLLPVEIAESVSEQLKKFADSLKEKTQHDPEAENRSVKFFLTRGVVSPKIWFGPESECPEDHILLDDLGSDSDVLVGQIINFSLEMPGLQSLGRFPEEPRAGDAGPSGQTILPETLPIAPNGDI